MIWKIYMTGRFKLQPNTIEIEKASDPLNINYKVRRKELAEAYAWKNKLHNPRAQSSLKWRRGKQIWFKKK